VLFFSIIFAQSNMAVAENSPAEKLVTVLPDDVLSFVATSGGDSLKPVFEKAILGRLWYDPGVQTFYQSIKKQLLLKIDQGMHDPDATRVFDTVVDFAKLAMHRPIIIGVAWKDAKKGPPFYGFAILDAGPRKTEIASALTKLEAMADEGDIIEIKVGSAKMHGPRNADDVPGYWGWFGNYLVFAINDDQGLAIHYLQKPRADVPNYLKKVPGTGDALALYIDCQKVFGVVNAVTEQEKATEHLNPAALVIKELDLANVKTITARIGFVGTDMVSSDLLEIPQPRTGLLANLKTVNLSMFDMVDARAVNAVAFNCDIAGLYDTIMRAIKAGSPNDVYPEIQRGIADFESEAKFNIRKGLLQSLAGPMISYSLPAGVLMDAPNGGIVIIAGLKDTALWEKSMSALGHFAAAKSDGMLQVSSQVQEERTMHTWVIMPLAMAQVMPCWTVMGDKVVIASNPTLFNLAVAQIGSGTKSIRGSEGFKKVTAKLPENLISFRYSNSKVQFNQLMMSMQQFWPMATMVAAKEGLTLPFILPSLSHIAEDMGPSCEYSWYDSEGYRSHYRGVGIEPSLGAVAGGALGVGIMMPALARTRQIARRVVSGTNLSGIGKALLIYANDYDDQFPPNLQELVEKVDLSPKILDAPQKPKSFDGPSYIYIAGQNTSMNPGNIIVYENPAFCREGVNVLFIDCHVQWMKPDEFLSELEATYKRLGREMPEIKFKSRKGAMSARQSRLSELLSTGRVDHGDETKRFALHKAAMEGDIEKVRSLITEGADVNARDKKRETPLYLAIQSGHTDVAQLLIDKGADVDAKGGRWWTPLHLAARFGHTDIVRVLVDKGANVNAAGGGGWTPLLLAVRFGNTDVAELLIDKGADMYARTNQEMTPLLFAILHNRKDIEKLLIDKGAQLDIFAETIRGNPNAVSTFLKNDPCLVNVEQGKFTPLHWAAYGGHIEAAKVLIAKGADVNAGSEYAVPLYWAVRKNHPNFIRLLVDEGADVNAKDMYDRTVLHWAVTPAVVELLIDKGADVNAKSKRGATPLHIIASRSGHIGILKLLLPDDADINASHPPALHLEAARSQATVAKLLIASGADVNATDNNGRTPLDIAEKAGYKAVTEVIRKTQRERQDRVDSADKND